MVGSERSPTRSRLPPTVWKVLLAGLIIREAFSFWTGHLYDFEAWVRTGFLVAQGQNPYVTPGSPVPGVSFAFLTQNLVTEAYLPFWPVLLGELYRLWMVVGGGNRFVLYFLLKQPGICADVATAFLLYRLAGRWTGAEAPALALLAFWSFFPYAIIITAIWGQFDSIVVAIMLGLLYARESLERNVLNGLGILVKWVTAIFLPLEIFRERGWRRLSFLVALAVPLVLTVALFRVEGWSLQVVPGTAISQTAGDGLGMNFVNALTVGPVLAVLDHVPVFYLVAQRLWIPGVILAGWGAAKWIGRGDRQSELRAMLLVLTVFLLIRWGLYEQYFLYLFGLLALDVAVFRPERRGLLVFTYAIAMVYLLIDTDLGLLFLGPVSPWLGTFVYEANLNAPWAVARTAALLALALVMTATLLQLVWVFWRDVARPRPWLYLVGDRLRFLVWRSPAP